LDKTEVNENMQTIFLNMNRF